MEQKSKKFASTSALTWMKLESGKHYTLRFLPLKSEALELPISIFHHHAVTFPDGHFESVACPKKSEDRECPFCTLATQMYRKYTKTEKEQYKEAFKKLVVKTHYLLVGFEPSLIDPSAIKPEDLKIVRASSKANMELIESKLAKEIDFIDFAAGRTVDMSKNKGVKGGFDTIVLDFNDPSVAIAGKNGKAVWDELLEKSPDLTVVVRPLDAEKLAAKYKEYISAPVSSDDEEDGEEEREMLDKVEPAKMAKPSPVKEEEDLPFDLDDMRKCLEDN